MLSPCNKELEMSKLYSNVLYGKMLENKRSHANIELVHNKKNIFMVGWQT